MKKEIDAAKKELAYLQGLITRKTKGAWIMPDARYLTREDGSMMSMERREQRRQMASRQINLSIFGKSYLTY